MVTLGSVNLHDWIDELCDVLDLDTEVDEGLVLDLARLAAHSVQRTAAPVTTFLLGYAAGLRDADPEELEALAAKVQQLAEDWDTPADQRDPLPDEDDVDDEAGDVPRDVAREVAREVDEDEELEDDMV